MEADTAPLRSATIERFTREFGEPVRRGDGCQWILNDAGGEAAVRLTLFVDGSPALADGWLVVGPQRRPEPIRITAAQEADELVARCRGASHAHNC
jgi:hypothetical protein